MVSEELKTGAMKMLTPVGFDLDGRSNLIFLKDRTFLLILRGFLEFVRTQRKVMTRDAPGPTPKKSNVPGS